VRIFTGLGVQLPEGKAATTARSDHLNISVQCDQGLPKVTVIRGGKHRDGGYSSTVRGRRSPPHLRSTEE